MELVKGLRITDYCDKNNLSTAERLGLFIQVCHAIQHAHQKGIIHRDIKPSNILVTLHDGVPVPKVIDFGIAKATTDQRLTDKTLYTAIEQFIGTPAYMSPEQAELSGLDIDTRSDIYALGVLLYELLTGKTPFDSQRLVAAGLNEIRRIIREEDAPRPSTRISTLDAGEQTAIAKRRQSDPPKLIHLMRGDLDWIAMKCLEKDRTRRYDTANGLGADIQRHFDNEAVTARPPTVAYRLSRTMRRHRLGFAAAAGVTLALALGLALAATAYLREREARKQSAEVAKDALAAALKVEQLAQALLQATGEGKHSLLRDSVGLSSLRKAAEAWPLERIQSELRDRPELQADLLIYRGTPWKMSDLLDTNQTAFMKLLINDNPEAIPMLKEGLRLRTELHGINHESAASAHGTLAEVLLQSIQWTASGPSSGTAAWTNTLAEAESHAREAVRVARLTRPESLDVADSLQTLSEVLEAQRHLGEATAARQEALAIKTKLLPPQSFALNGLRSLLASLQEESGDLDAAVESWKSAVAGLGKDSATLIGVNIRLKLARLLQRTGNLQQAESECREALRLAKDRLASREAEPQFDQRSVCISLWLLSAVLEEQGKFDAAVEACREALPLAEALGFAKTYMLRTRLGRLLAKWSLADSKDGDPTSASRAAALTRAREAEQSLRAEATRIPPDGARGDLGLAIMALVTADPSLQPEARTAKLREAEQLLLARYGDLQQQDAGGDEDAPKAQRDAAARLLRLYELWDKPEEAARWKRELQARSAGSPRL